MNRNMLLTALAGLCFAGCSVMHFKNGDVKNEGHVQEKWHHNAAFSLMELSPVLNLSALCPEKNWSMITTKETFLTGLAGSADEAVTGALLHGAGIDLWNPQAIEWYCGGAIAGNAASPAPDDSAK
ncbi:MAG TPA: hypothetical protein VJ385_16420 [Fibrobacteria bacterium]|nr:hypothetical protein [Fibrobacteria bacterium]